MRIFAVLLMLLNLGYWAWESNLGGFRPEAPVMVRSPSLAAPQTLRLLSEVAMDSVVGDDGAVEEESALLCPMLGVFADEAEGEAFIERLLQLDYRAQIERVEVAEAPDYWVHMPPFVSEAAAFRKLEELKAKNIESYVISSGILARGISLGLFSKRESALSVQQALQQQGYEAEIAEVPRSYTEIWVKILPLEANPGRLSSWQDLLKERSDLQHVENLCETIAPED